MYLHLGQDKVVSMDEIIGIFDLDTSTVSKATRDYLAKAEKDGCVTNVCTDLPKSFIVCIGRDQKRTSIFHRYRRQRCSNARSMLTVFQISE